MSLIAELKRRNVIRVAIAYIIVAWLTIQVIDVLVPLLSLPEVIGRALILVLVVGFPIALIFAWAFELTPEGIKKEREVDRSASITHTTARKLDFVIIGVLVVGLLMFSIDKFVLSPDTAVDHVASTETISIAVLPFADMSPEKDQEYFSDGISEEILNGLAKLKSLKVAARTSSFAFKGRNEDLREIGLALGVQNVLEGSIRKDGNTLRITAQLIKVSDGFHLWSETYDRELADIFSVQDEISASIVSALRGNLLGESVDAKPSQQIDVETYEKYLQAKVLLTTRTNQTLVQARAMLEEIVVSEPEFAPAYAALAETILLLRAGFGTYGDIQLCSRAGSGDGNRLPRGQHCASVVAVNHPSLGRQNVDVKICIAGYRTLHQCSRFAGAQVDEDRFRAAFDALNRAGHFQKTSLPFRLGSRTVGGDDSDRARGSHQVGAAFDRDPHDLASPCG